MKFKVDWVPPSTLGQNSHKHWRHKHPDEQAAHMIGWTTANASRYGEQDVPDMPVLIVKFYWPKAQNKKDSDNALGVAKHLIDGLCRGLGIDDRRFITSMAFQAVDTKKRGFTEITIRPATKEERRLAS